MTNYLRTAIGLTAACLALWWGSGQLSPPATASTITVRSGGDLQAALNNARPGDVITLEAGAVFEGNFVLPARRDTGTAFITIRSSAPDFVLPGPAQRITPAFASRLPKLRSPNSAPALSTAPGAHHYRLLCLEFPGTPEGFFDIITLGDGSEAQTSLSTIPHNIVLDRVYVHGDPVVGQKRGIALNSAATSVINSHISDIKRVGQDTQAIAGWNGPGPYHIENNYLEGSAENIIFGGEDPAVTDLVPSDITITRNHIAKPVKWRAENWQVKNLLELKNARRVRITDNVLEYNWQAAQNGFAILFTVRSGGKCHWCAVQDIVFERNVVRHVAAGISILGYDDGPGHVTEQSRNFVIRHNVFVIDEHKWGGNGYFMMIQGEPRDILVDHNTIIQEHAQGLIQVDGPPVHGFTFTNNISRHHDYGIIGTGRSQGNSSISVFFPGSHIAGNVLAGGNPDWYPAGNRFPSEQEFKRQFASYDAGDFGLTGTSQWRRAGTDGLDLGANGVGSVLPRGPRSTTPTGPPGGN